MVTIGTYQFDALGRRIKKVVTHSGTLDGTTYFYYNDRWQLLEARDGSENVDTQVIYGERDQGGSVNQYVDEIVRVFKLGYGTMYIFQGEMPARGIRRGNVVRRGIERERAAIGKAGTTPASGERVGPSGVNTT